MQSKVDRVRQTIGGNEQDFRQFVKVLEGTTQKWEAEWRGFCDVSALKFISQPDGLLVAARAGSRGGQNGLDEGHHVVFRQRGFPSLCGRRWGE